ncbi:hypothetical protein HFP89_14650 [Wenzhouxiangella sp. XN79A]|uniref:hypothetical protein n=1 Tax=Wenzhouxiangella sp. XN79A TaxID=2724193 RepID=UPI00144AEDDE|nr:hypothetical protein [Wenzhouxiangella sp. XN79A]NKI36407.1 hypothetical protein [Wenzhouxiangella sp. XN79A]
MNNRISKFFLATSALACASAWAGPVGTLDADAAYDVRAAGETEFVRFTQNGATFYTGDTLRTHRGAAVLNLNAGGGLGFHEGSEATVGTADDGAVRVDLQAGRVLYALPEAAQSLVLTAGNFTLTTASPDTVRVDVARSGEFVGTVHRLEGGNVKVEVQSGALHVRNGAAMQLQVDAGETVGLLDLPATAAVDVQAESAIRIVAPETVGPNESFDVVIDAPGALDGNYLAVAPQGAAPSRFDSVASIRGENSVAKTAPGTEGDYEIRLIDEDTGEILAFVPLSVTRPEAVVAAASSVGAGGGGGFAGPIMAVGAGALAVYIVSEASDDDDDPQPVSP